MLTSIGKVLALHTVTVPLLLALCSEPAAGQTDAELRRRARELAREILLIDTHVDTPYEIRKTKLDISRRNEKGHFDYVRAREGGLDAVFMAVYVPPEREEKGDARAFADETIDLVNTFGAKWPEKFVLARSVSEVRQQFGGDRVTIVMGMENGSSLEGDLANLRHFYDRGIRYVTLCHSKNNHICDSSFDSGPKWHGLSPFGKELVPAMNRLGMMIDVSHVSDDAFYQVLELSKAPVVATHSGCRHFTPGWHRNVSDEMIRRLAAKGGLMQINFGSMFVNTRVNEAFRAYRRKVNEHIEAHNLEGDERERYIRQQWKGFRLGRADIGDVVAHIEHVIQLVGVDHVGLGSDFDGVTSLPEGLDDVSGYPNLIYELLKKGRSTDDIRKICAENFLRVWAEVERSASPSERK
jgi:membrane dipeptidase